MFPGYRWSRGVFGNIITPGLLEGFCFYSSSFSKTSFYCTAFVQALYVPFDAIVLSVGTRAGFEASEREWDSKVLSWADRTGRAFLEDHNTIEQLMRHDHRHRDDIRALEQLAYSQVFIGDKRAEKTLSLLAERNVEGEYEWVREVVTRSQKLLVLFKESPVRAKEKLNEWAAYTLAATKLDYELVTD